MTLEVQLGPSMNMMKSKGNFPRTRNGGTLLYIGVIENLTMLYCRNQIGYLLEKRAMVISKNCRKCYE